MITIFVLKFILQVFNHCNNIFSDSKSSVTKTEPSSSIELTEEKNEQTRRDSILFEEVSQGLVKLDSTGSKVENKCKFYH